MDPAQELELSALARQKPMNDVIDRGDSNVQQFYAGTTVFVTGGSGFIGKQLIEKLFRSCAINKMYFLIRPKGSKSIEERLAKIFEDQVYDSVRKRQPQFKERIVPIEGDVADIHLGICDKDWNTLTEEVNIIFHVAATVRFDEPLQKATLTNIRGTREVLELARHCKGLKKFVHVSTAFSFATKEHIGKDVLEEIYTCPISPKTMIDLAENIDENRLNKITAKLIEGWPNTYTFTKCIAEQLIRANGDLPVCITRPSIVLPAYYEPAPGWLDLSTVVGPSGIYLGVGLGVLRVFWVDSNAYISIAPVDYVNNAIIAAAWDSTERQKLGQTEISVYNLAKDLRFGFINETGVREIKRFAIPKAIGLSNLIHIKSRWLYLIIACFLHYIPAYLLDFSCSVIGKKPKDISSFVEIYRKVDKLGKVYHYFSHNKWNFKDDNIKSMIKRMSDADKAIFNCNLDLIDLKDYIIIWGIGLRKYIIKDGLTGTQKGYRRQQIFNILNYIILILYAGILCWIFRSVYLFGKYILIKYSLKFFYVYVLVVYLFLLLPTMRKFSTTIISNPT